MNLRACGIILLGLGVFSGPLFAADQPPLASVLDPIRLKYNLPALAGAIYTTDGVVEMAAVGVRKRGADVAVTTGDLWHLGSDTKAMTATLAGTYVAEGKLAWDDKVISFFPDIADQVSPAMLNVTVGQVMSHQAGLAKNLDWWELSKIWALSKMGTTLTQQRALAARRALATANPPGKFLYANTDYVVLGAILEKIGGKPWEDLIRERVFEPLGMQSAGFGGLGTPGQIDEPWPHKPTGDPLLLNGPTMDNAEVVGPAARVHCTMSDWAKFLVDQLRGGAGMKALLPNKIYQAMQTPAPSFNYAYGWSAVYRPWAEGLALNHSGSNTLNYCVCWLSPEKKFGILLCSNQGGDAAVKACEEASNALILRYEAKLLAAGQ